METEEVIKLVDNIYKNILDKFNPGARQLISAGKAYLKALHGTSAASRVFNEALAKIAVNAQQGGTNDIGSALMNIVGVYKDIQDQHMNILKAFYVDLLVPLETNLEKDTKVVQFEQKRFMQQHKIRSDSYSKATATMKKQRKKKGNAQNADKEIKSIQAVDEEKNKLDAFCEQSLKNAMTQERRRYGFVLERQCSLAKHWIAYHSAGKNYILNNLDNWEEVSASREFLPPNMENVFARQMIVDMHNENDMDDDSDRGSVISALRKTRSIDASCLDMRSIGDVVANGASSRMPRAKSEFNLTSSSSTIIDAPKWDKRTVSRGLYAYLSSGENQLSFLEGDRIALVGDRAKGWQFGENLRTHSFGWFPVAYTELEQEDNHNNWGSSRNGQTELLAQHHSQQQLQHQQQQSTQQQSIQAQPQHHQQQPKQKHHQTSASSHGAQQRSSQDHQLTPDSSLESTVMDEPLLPAQVQHAYNEDASTQRMFGDTIMYRQSKHSRRVSGGIATGTAGQQQQQQQQPKPGPPPTLPAPVPQPTVPGSGGSYPSSSSASSHSQISQMSQSQKFMANGGDGGGASMSNVEKRKSMPAGANYGKQQQVNAVSKPKARNSVAVNNASLHSSNDSGFANELAPPQPDVDYSDDDTVTRVPIRSHPVTRSPSNVHAVAASNKKSSRIPTRRQNERDSLPTPAKSTTSGVSHSKSSSTLMRPNKSAKNSGEMRPSTSYGNLTSEELLQQQQQDADFVYRTIDRKANGNIIKRTKSFWKFGKGDDILEGMAMWRHRDLVPADGELDDDADDEVQPVVETATLRRQQQQRTATVAPAALSGQQQKSSTLSSAHSTETLTNVASSGVEMHEMGEYLVKNGMVIDGNVGNKYHFTKSEIDSRISAMQTTMQQQQQQQHQQHDRQQQPQPQPQQQQQQHSGNKHRESVAYETAPEEEDESIYDVQPKTRQMANMNVMSRDKVIRQAYLESEREMQENNAQQQAAYQQDKQYRSSRTEKLAAYNGGQQQQHSSQKQQTQQQPPAPAAATSTTKKKKTKTQSKQPLPVAQPQPPIEYYQRAETPDTIHHDDAVFDDEDIMNDNAVRVRDTDFYDDESADDVAIMMKTVKRQDILKQYYNSSDGGTDDTEQNSTSSDAYDCIVVEDHHVVRRGQQQQQAGGGGAVAGNGGGSHHHQHHDGKTGKMEFKTFRGGNDDKDSGMESSRPGTLLPRTKLSKANSGGGSGQMSSTGAAQSVQSNGGAKGEKSGGGGGKRSRTDRTTAERNERAERNDRKDRGDRGAERSTRHEREERRERDNSRNDTSHDKYYRSSDIESSPSVKSYGPWYDLWDKDMTVRK